MPSKPVTRNATTPPSSAHGRMRHRVAHPDGGRGVTGGAEDSQKATALATFAVLAIFVGPWLFIQLGGGSLFGSAFHAAGRVFAALGNGALLLPTIGVVIMLGAAAYLAATNSGHIHDVKNKFRPKNLLPRRRNRTMRSSEDEAQASSSKQR